MNSDNVILKIFRFDPENDTTPRYDSYEIPHEEGMTVQIALKNIYENIDNTLAYKNTFCYSMQCYGCLVKFDKGKQVTLVRQGYRRHPGIDCRLDQRLDSHQTIHQRVFRVNVEMDKCGGDHGGNLTTGRSAPDRGTRLSWISTVPGRW